MATQGNDTISGSTGNEFIDGLGGDDSLSGHGGNDTLMGSAGNDTLLGGIGNDSLDGGTGTDTASFEFASGGVFASLESGTASGEGSDTLVAIENLRGSGTGGDTLHGDAQANVLTGDGGNDTLFGKDGDDLIEGGAGTDMACFDGSVSQYVITPGANEGDFTVSGPDGTDTLTGIEMFDFGGEQITPQEGTSGDDDLDGTSGDDIILARGGDDVVDGAAGNDALFGEAGDDSLSGGSGNDLLDGGEGVDTMAGGSGDDTFVVDNVLDVVQESELALPRTDGGALQQVSVGGGIDKVVASINYSLASAGNSVENLQLSGTQDLSGTGNAVGNVITGNSGNNELDGAEGNDTLDGAAGIDTAIYAQLESLDAEFHRTGTGWEITTAEGVDVLLQIERLHFSDFHIALDLEGNAGMVAKIIGALLGAPYVHNENLVGIGLDYADTGMGYEALMQLALDAILGPEVSMETVVRVLFFNLVGVQATEGQVAHFSSLGLTDVQLAMLAADHSLNTDNIGLAGLMETGLAHID